MSDRRSRAEELGLELMDPEPARLPNADARTRQLGDLLADLGYNRLQDAVAKPVELKALKPENLLQALRMANITPFTWESVNRYKFDTINKLHNPPWLATTKRYNRISSVSFWLSVPAFLSAGMLSGYSAMFAIPVGLIGVGCAIVSAVTFERSMDLFGKHGAELFRSYVWETAKLKDYQKEIPIEAAERIAAVRAIYPKAKFEIEFLTENPDPFLVACHGDERYAIAVWDEPTFEGELLA